MRLGRRKVASRLYRDRRFESCPLRTILSALGGCALGGERRYTRKGIEGSNPSLSAKLRFARQEAVKLLKKPQAYVSKIKRGVAAVELAEFAKVYGKDINHFIK
ncbi:MAG: hypothetical protein CO029_04285 [Candidatus Magasanikbacteria bacterium CG_4_9_14_0_2_um_filter_41_10]|nr:MAG: hypothetical protein CO029_04285 [Candidatus Magasanikbacteria bacterium CG_4_9_14_0_2_um_filter_41_10]